ncbi:hypothetical protein LINPERHAP1_LOCUS32007, partial [Linum perenne]
MTDSTIVKVGVLGDCLSKYSATALMTESRYDLNFLKM